jgi:hypothetical protein
LCGRLKEGFTLLRRSFATTVAVRTGHQSC